MSVIDEIDVQNLPEERTIVYLDQNKWIELAKAFYRAAPNKGAQEVLETLHSAVDADRVIVPISIVHFIETSKIGDDSRREKLIEIFLYLCRGWVVRPLVQLAVEETQRWAEGRQPGSNSALARGLFSVLADYEAAGRHLGRSAGEVEFEDRFSDHPLVWREVLSQRDFHERNALIIPTLLESHVQTVERSREAWSRLPPKLRRGVYARSVVRDLIECLSGWPRAARRAVERLEALPPTELSPQTYFSPRTTSTSCRKATTA